MTAPGPAIDVPTALTGATVTVTVANDDQFSAVTDLVRDAGLPLDGLAEASLVLVATAGGHVVGAAALEEHGPGTDRAFLLRSVVVAAGGRGTGVGTALVTTALAHVDSVHVPVGLLTETADDYFPRFGFTVVPRTALPPALEASAQLRGACSATATAMLRPAC